MLTLPGLPNLAMMPTPSYVLPLSGGALGLYLAARFATAAVVGHRGYAGTTAGRVAAGHWVAIAAVAIIAAARGRPDVAGGIVFATAVAAAGLAVGMTASLAPPTSLPETRRAWPFLLPAGLLVLLGGFGASLTIVHAIMLAVIGVMVLNVWWSAETTDAETESLLAAADGAARPPTNAVVALRVLECVLALVLAFVAGRAVVTGIVSADATDTILRAGILTTGAVAPALILPLLAAGTDLAQRGRSGVACSACVGVALLNVLLLLPLVVVVNWIRGGIFLLPPDAPTGLAPPGLLQRLSAFVGRVPAMQLDLAVWRVDTVVISVVGLALLPIALGRWKFGRLEATGLLFGYAAYLAVKAMLAASGGMA